MQQQMVDVVWNHTICTPLIIINSGVNELAIATPDQWASKYHTRFQR